MSGFFSGIELPAQLTFGYGVGTAAAGVLRPQLEGLRQTSWLAMTGEGLSVPPNPLVLAEGVAQGKIDYDLAAMWATYEGVNKQTFDSLVNILKTGPELGYAFRAWRRGTLSDSDFTTAMRRSGLETAWFAAMKDLKNERLELGAVATAVHRGIMDDAGLLVTPVPAGTGNVPRIPVSTLDTLAEFAAQGIDPERARVLVADTGLPLSLGEMLTLYNRGKVTETDVKVSIAESNVRNEYMDVALELARRLLTAHEQAEAELRGVKTRAEAEAGAADLGYTAADYETLFEIMGRPLNVHEITTALARGGTFGGTYDDVPEPYRSAIRRSAIRPEFAVMAYTNRFTYPGAFVLRGLAEAGDLGTTADVEQLLLEIAWPPSLAKKVSAKWVPAGAAADPHVKKAQAQLWTSLHSSYVKGEIGAAAATAALPTAAVDPAAIPEVLAVWDVERATTRAQLSVSQIQKALKKGLVNPATGQPWTDADATAAFLERGYSADDAATLIAED